MKSSSLVFACAIWLSACTGANTLQGQFAVGAIRVDKRSGPLGLTIEVSTTANLIEEIQRIGSVTYGYLICPLNKNKIFYPQEAAGPALVAPIHELWLDKNPPPKQKAGNKFHYQLAGEFLDAKADRVGVPVPVAEVVSLLKKHTVLDCNIVILRYLGGPYFSNTTLLKTPDLIKELANSTTFQP